ncbi:putative methylesterase 14, chloroplastic [Capsicum annuum]|uniref:Methylesterase 14, chloroplastic n=1 Tax=Capsicum annuum TaxID=4072 RepID=A0A2G2ZB17_CAPAN|nr:putative methylesterase 14, chloroplastic [Capsicum annuum]
MERSKRRSLLEEEFFHRLALSLAIQQHQLSQRFDGSISKRIGSTSSHRRSDLPEHLSNSKQWDYSKPLIDYLENFPGDEKCWRCLCFLCLRAFPTKIAKAVFICATMISDCQRPFDVFAEEDVALAMVSMRPIPLGLMMDKLSLTPEKYGTSRRFYIQTFDDHALSPDVQEKLVRVNPPGAVFKIKGSDHSPFFSKPQSLHKILVEIAQIP